jgi:hypothetical protein
MLPACTAVLAISSGNPAAGIDPVLQPTPLKMAPHRGISPRAGGVARDARPIPIRKLQAFYRSLGMCRVDIVVDSWTETLSPGNELRDYWGSQAAVTPGFRAEQSFQAAADTEPLELYLTTQVGNSFYYASEVIVMSTALRMAVSGTSHDDRAAFAKLCDDVIAASRNITELFGQLMGDDLEYVHARS